MYCNAYSIAGPVMCEGRSSNVPKKPDRATKNVPTGRKEWIAVNAMQQATLKDLRKAARRTQEDLAAALGVGQGAVSRLEKSNDMLLSTLRHYVESVGGRLEMVATFPNRPALLIGRLGKKTASRSNADPATPLSAAKPPKARKSVADPAHATRSS